jgi:pimeloyl-ACP methyl ester carboxylesterase
VGSGAGIVDVLDRLGDGSFVLVGHSWGGPIVRLAVAARRHRGAWVCVHQPVEHPEPSPPQVLQDAAATFGLLAACTIAKEAVT